MTERLLRLALFVFIRTNIIQFQVSLNQSLKELRRGTKHHCTPSPLTGLLMVYKISCKLHLQLFC